MWKRRYLRIKFWGIFIFKGWEDWDGISKRGRGGVDRKVRGEFWDCSVLDLRGES